MTKEELAKKRGIKISKETPSPSEALLTAKPRPQKAVRTATKKRAVKKTATPIKSPAKPSPEKIEQADEPKTAVINQTKSNPVPEPVKNKGGRPKIRTEAVKIANIAIPLSVYNDMTAHALAVYDNNLTGYINSLIRKDLDANLDNYKKVSAVMRKAKGL